MDTRIWWIVLFVVVSVPGSFGQQNTNEIITSESKPNNWMKSAQNILAGPAGQMMVQMAKELISRSSGNSQILSLNLGNLVVLVLLKALIFGVGMIGAGNWSHYARKMNDEDPIFTVGEPTLLLGFLAAQGSGRDGCLHRAACRAPRVAFEYARAGKALLNGIEMFSDVSEKERYIKLIEFVEKSAYDGYKGAPCDVIYNCDV